MRVRTYVNEAKRTVVVVIDEIEFDFIGRVRKVLRARHRDDWAFRGNASYILGTVRGKAKCHPDDEWDEALGIAIARERAFEKYQDKWNREVDELLHRTEMLTLELEGLYRD
jgi:hypothetical protein